jgi:hypothetical protein
MASNWVNNELVNLKEDPAIYSDRSPATGCNPDALLPPDSRLFKPRLNNLIGIASDAEEVRDPEQLLGQPLQYTTPQQIEAAGRSGLMLGEDVWSGSDWPATRGLLGRRYGDAGFEKAANWQDRLQYIQSHQISATDRDLLSPSEKYDILVGDENGMLTKAAWDEVQYYGRQENGIPDWYGICDGWAAAACMLKRPRKAVSVMAADGKQLIFYPSDIKALASQLWAVHGGRKNKQKRYLGGDSLHPGAWHLAIVNQRGKRNSVLIVDLAGDERAFNYPIVGYSFQYFNPREAWNQSVARATSLQKATVSVGDFVNNPKIIRNENTKSVVGIAMCVTYVGNPPPKQSLIDEPSRSELSSVGYLYDIELDHTDTIIDGYWYKKPENSPQLLWTFPEGTQAATEKDAALKEKWLDTRTPPPETWREAVKASTGKNPLAVVVNALISFAERSGL